MESKESVIEHAEQLLAFEYQKTSAVIELSRPQAINILEFVTVALGVFRKKGLQVVTGNKENGQRSLNAEEQFEGVAIKLQDGISLRDEARKKRVPVLMNLSEIEALKGLNTNKSPDLKEVKKRVGTNVTGLIKKFEVTLRDQKTEGVVDDKN